MITFDVYVEEKKRRKVMTLNEYDVADLIRKQAQFLFPSVLSIVATVEASKEQKEC